MHLKRILGLALLSLVLLTACGEKEVIVPDNTAPPDRTISDIEMESYINRSYITLLGRKPEPAEFDSGEATLRANNASSSDRDNFLAEVMGKSGYHENLFAIARGSILNGADTTEMQETLAIFNLLLQDPQYAPIYDQLNYEIGRLEAVLAIPQELADGTIDVQEMHRRMIDNYYYDQINMGTQNFVIANFQNFMFRYPTTYELDNGILMVEGFPAVLLYESGDSREDFMNIFFGSTDYYEGQVVDLIARYLYREPGSGEMETLAMAYKTSQDYQALQMTILKSKEYAGF